MWKMPLNGETIAVEIWAWADETVRFSMSGAIPGCGVLSRESRAQAGALVVTHPKNEQSATKQFNVSQKFAAA
jgi:hypothetical protein